MKGDGRHASGLFKTAYLGGWIVSSYGLVPCHVPLTFNLNLWAGGLRTPAARSHVSYWLGTFGPASDYVIIIRNCDYYICVRQRITLIIDVALGRHRKAFLLSSYIPHTVVISASNSLCLENKLSHSFHRSPLIHINFCFPCPSR